MPVLAFPTHVVYYHTSYAHTLRNLPYATHAHTHLYAIMICAVPRYQLPRHFTRVTAHGTVALHIHHPAHLTTTYHAHARHLTLGLVDVCLPATTLAHATHAPCPTALPDRRVAGSPSRFTLLYLGWTVTPCLLHTLCHFTYRTYHCVSHTTHALTHVTCVTQRTTTPRAAAHTYSTTLRLRCRLHLLAPHTSSLPAHTPSPLHRACWIWAWKRTRSRGRRTTLLHTAFATVALVYTHLHATGHGYTTCTGRLLRRNLLHSHTTSPLLPSPRCLPHHHGYSVTT